MTILDSILKSRNITLSTKVHLVKAMVFPVVVYGCDSNSYDPPMTLRVHAFGHWYEGPSTSCVLLEPRHSSRLSDYNAASPSKLSVVPSRGVTSSLFTSQKPCNLLRFSIHCILWPPLSHAPVFQSKQLIHREQTRSYFSPFP